MKTPKLTQLQCETIADILVVSIYADGHLSSIEANNMAEKINDLGWDENQSPSVHINNSIAKYRETVDKIELAKDVLLEKAEILGSEEVRNYCFNKAYELLRCDGVTREERELIVLLRYALYND